VNADPDLHLLLAQVEGRLAGRGHGAGGQGHAMLRPLALTRRHSSATSLSEAWASAAAPQIFSASTVVPTPASPGGVQTVLDRHVVVDDDRLHLDVIGLGEVRGHLEVEDVTGVVLDDVEHPGAAADRLGGLQDWSGVGEVKTHPGRPHPACPSPEAAVHRLVPRASAGDERRLAADRASARTT